MKIDCSKTVNYLKEKNRMTNSCQVYCGDCPLSRPKNGINETCGVLEIMHPEQAVEIVQKWSDEHPL